MPAIRYGLPTSITPDLLARILRYEPRHWRVLQPRLVRERPAVWEGIHMSDDDFYAKLYDILKDPDNRRALETAAQKERTKNRSLTPCGEIQKYYARLLRNDPSFSDRLPESPSPTEFVEALADCGDDDRLANVVWAFAEDGLLTCAQLSKISMDHPDIRERLGGTVTGIEIEAKPVAERWVECLSRIRGTLETAGEHGPDSGLAARIAGYSDELRELAVESEQQRSIEFQRLIEDLIYKHRDVLSHHDSLKPYIRVLNAGPPARALPGGAGELVEEIDRHLASLARIADSILEKSKAMGEANADKRGRLLNQMDELRKQEAKTRSDAERLLAELFSRAEPDVDAETPAMVVDAARSRTPADGGDNDALAVTADGIEAVSEDVDHAAVGTAGQDVEEETASHEPMGNDIEVVDVPLPADTTLQAAGGVAEGLESVGDKTDVALGSEPTTSQEEPGVEPAGTQESLAAKQGDDETLETSAVWTTPSQEDEADTSDSAPDESHEDPALPDASEALDEMLSSGRFSRAYWLARADCSLGAPDLLGALCEGARIGPGDPCPGILAQFFDALANKDSWTDDERLLLSAAALGPCLFVDPLPQGIYQLAGQLPVEGSPVGPLMQKVRDLCVHQSTKIRPEHLGIEPADTARGARLDDLAREAQDFLARVPHIHFSYPPADQALRFLYRAGSDWRRLHVIVGENRSNSFKEARALAETLDPANVVASLHDETELVALTKPLVGSARDKLARHLHNTIGLAREWIRLTEAGRRGSERTNGSRGNELRHALEGLLPAARNALRAAGARGPVHALDRVLADVEAQLQARPIEARPALSGDLLLLPNLPLEDDLEPIDAHLDELRRAILDAEQAEPEPRAIFKECLDRQEYRRTRKILEIHELGAQAHEDYRQAVKDKRSSLEATLNEVEIEIEDAFLLGQLREGAEGGETDDDSNHSTLERSQLLSVVREARDKLHSMSEPEADGLREIARAVREVSAKVEDMASCRREKLRREFDSVMAQLPETEQGQADRGYLREAFQECIENNDDVAAFDLLDRGRRAAQNLEAVARASTGSSEALEHFLERTGGYRKALTGKGWLSQTEKSIRGGGTVAGIAFGQLDARRRDEAASGLRIWNSLFGLRFPGARDELKRSMDTLLRFVGLPVKADGVELADTTEEGFAHIRANLTRPVSSSPLPAFGSACGTCFEIVVSQARKEPEQVEEYIRGRRLTDKPVLAYLLLPQSSTYRRHWQRHCARRRLTALPLDLTLFLHLCGERNRLATLLEIGLPFTWSRPYITKGENVAEEMFVGRGDEAAALMDPMGSCIVFGGRQLGKSALLRHVHRKNHDPDASTYVIYLDVDDLGMDPQDHDTMTAVFWRRVYDELHRHGALPALPAKTLGRERQLTEKVPQSIETCLSENEHMRIVLLLDESDDLLDCDSGRDFALVRRLRGLMAGTGRRFKVVFAGLQSVQRYNNWKNHPFAQLGSEVVVNPLPPAAAQDLIIRPLRTLGFAFENTSLILRILSQTNYHPGLIQIICYRLLENLYEKWQRREHDGAIRHITSDDILGVERDATVMEDIRNRFDWTLDLDDRYKVLTYALVLTSDPTTPHLEAELMDIGASWWPSVFGTMDPQGVRAVLDEMVGLGVLLKEHEGGVRYSYRLRSPNLLRLLGPREAIESELIRITERNQVSRANPRNYHPIIDRKPVAFGPLTNEQQGQISGHLRPFHLSIISGSDALGIGRVERQINKLLDDASKDDGSKPWKKIKHLGPMQADSLVRKLQETLRPRSRDHRYAIVRLEEIEFEERISTLLDRFVKELGNVCTNESKGHLVILLDPSGTWRWLGDQHRERVLAKSRVTGLALRRWSDGAIANALDQIDARTGSKVAADEVFARTSGFHQLVDEGLRRAGPRHDVNAQNLIGEWGELCGEVLTVSGVEAALTALGLLGSGRILEVCVWEVLRLTEERDGIPMLVQASFDLAAEELSEEDRSLLKDGGVRIREWMRTMDLVRPGSAHEDGAMAVASWVQEVVKMKTAEA